MSRNTNNEIQVLLDRAQEDRRYVYTAEDLQGHDPGYAMLRNRHGVRRKLTLGTLLLWMGVGSFAGVLYVGNSIEVDRLAIEVGKLQDIRDHIVHENDVLRAELNLRSSLERISPKASELGLHPASSPPVWFTIDESKIRMLERGK
ncbi:MAG: hypothetical protein ACP5JH_07785 [Bacteroidota bacterium]